MAEEEKKEETKEEVKEEASAEAKPEAETKEEAESKPEAKSEESMEHKIKIDIIKKILDDKKEGASGDVQVVDVEGGVSPEGEVPVEGAPVEAEGSGEKKDYKELLKKSGIIAGIILGVILLIFIGGKLSMRGAPDPVGSATQVLEVEEEVEVEIEEEEEKSEKEYSNADIRQLIDLLSKEKGLIEEPEEVLEEEVEEEPIEKEKTSKETEEGIFGKLTGFIGGLLDEDSVKEEKEEPEEKEDSGFGDKLRNGLANLISSGDD